MDERGMFELASSFDPINDLGAPVTKPHREFLYSFVNSVDFRPVALLARQQNG